MSSARTPGATVTHAGTVVFRQGQYTIALGTDNWKVGPIPWPGLEPPPPVGQVLITFAQPIDGPYAVLVTAARTPDAPMLAANYGDTTANGFVVVLFNAVGDRSFQTVRNGDFSFLVMQ